MLNVALSRLTTWHQPENKVMEKEAMKRIAYSGYGFALFAAVLVSPAGAQQQGQPSSTQPQNQPSLADYARQVKKDPGQPKSKPKVFDNDNLPKEDKLSIVGEQTSAAANSSADAKPADPSGNAPAAADTKPAGETKNPAAADDEAAKRQAAWKQWQQKINAQKDQIDLLERELDVLRREYQVRAAAFYADAGDRLRNSAAWDKQDAQYKQQIADKQKTLDDAKQIVCAKQGVSHLVFPVDPSRINRERSLRRRNPRASLPPGNPALPGRPPQKGREGRFLLGCAAFGRPSSLRPLCAPWRSS